MDSSPVVLGINRTADGSICLIGANPYIWSVQKERYTRRKHHWGKLNDFKDWYAKRLPGLETPLDLIVECYSSDPEVKRLEDYHQELREVLKFRGEPSIIRISHHLAHLYSTFFLSSYKEAAVMVTDFQGSRVEDFTEEWPEQPGARPHWVEVASFYHCTPDGIRCFGKQLWDNDRLRPVGLGGFYNYLTHVIFAGRGMEGKVMGLAPFGDPYALALPQLIVEDGKVFIPDEWQQIFKDQNRFRYFKDGQGTFEDCANLAAAGQFCFEQAELALARWVHAQTGSEVLCLAGGTALNCVANGRLLRESPFKDVFVPPSPHDGGTALGCALYGLIERLGVSGDFRWVNDFLAPEPNLDNVEALLADDTSLSVEQPANLIEEMVDLLESGRTLALYYGRSELGPRALGHRSILADPRHPSIRSWINKHVKGRELFRPLAPVVLEEDASDYFEIDRPVPFMQYAVNVRPDKRDLIPAVTHVDGTARLQTVSEREDPFFYELLKAFKVRTGLSVLLNTSFNGMGEPIVETPAEALVCFKSSALHALAMPPYLLHKLSEPEIPARDETEASRQEELQFRPVAQAVQ